MQNLNKKLLDTLAVFSDLQHLYVYQEDTRGVLKKMYENTLEVLSNPDIDVSKLIDSNGNNLLHLAASADNIEFFIKVSSKGVNPYLLNNQNKNSFQSRHYDFANSLWKKFEHIYFDNKIHSKSFEHLTCGFNNSFKQSIYEKNIQNNASQYDIIELTKFLKKNKIYSHTNVLLFSFEKYNEKLTNLLDFILHNQETLTPEENSLALHCGLKYMSFSNKKLESCLFFDLFVNEAKFSIDFNFLQSIKISAENYFNSSFEPIFNKQTQILIDNQYDLEKELNFYLSFKHKKNNQDHYSVQSLAEIYRTLSLDPVWNYYKINNMLKLKENNLKIKKPKI